MSLTVLIVDDHTAFRTGVRELLKADGYDVVGEEGDGRSGLRAADALRPDIVLVDVRLPDMEGFAVAEQLARLRITATVVIMSSCEDPLYPDRAADCGACGFVAKHDVCGAALERLVAAARSRCS